MSIRAMTNVFDRQDIKSPTDRFVLIALVDHASEDGENIYPSINRLVSKTGFSDRTIQSSIKSLIEQGVLVRRNSGKGGRNITNRFAYVFKNTEVDSVNPEADDIETPKLTAENTEGDSPESSVNHHKKEPSLIKDSPTYVPVGDEFEDKPKKRVKTYKHPALLLYREIVHRYVPRVYEQDVALVVGENPPDLARWGAHVKKWVGRGWNPQNIDGMLEAFRNGGIKDKKPSSDERREQILQEISNGNGSR